MRSTYITATVIAVLTALWLASGRLGESGDPASHPTLADRNLQAAATLEDVEPTRVRGKAIRASERTAHVSLRGRTENKRTVEVRAETMGRIVDRPVERGTQVETGDLLCRISVEDRNARLNRAREALNQARIEYQGSLRLQSRGFQSETAIATARAKLAAAEADLEGSKLDLERIQIRAPFAGVVEATHVEIGDFVQLSSPCATVVDLDPMLLVAQVSERNVDRLVVGTIAIGALATGVTVSGPISFVGKQADESTRTYRVDVEVANADYAIPSGITTQIEIPTERILAHKLSSALFALDDEGNVGVRTVNERNEVEFHRVEIVEDAADGIWVSGLPAATVLITVGQELVVPGEVVNVDFEPVADMPAARPTDGTQVTQPADAALSRAPASEAS